MYRSLKNVRNSIYIPEQRGGAKKKAEKKAEAEEYDYLDEKSYIPYITPYLNDDPIKMVNHIMNYQEKRRNIKFSTIFRKKISEQAKKIYDKEKEYINSIKDDKKQMDYVEKNKNELKRVTYSNVLMRIRDQVRKITSDIENKKRTPEEKASMKEMNRRWKEERDKEKAEAKKAWEDKKAKAKEIREEKERLKLIRLENLTPEEKAKIEDRKKKQEEKEAQLTEEEKKFYKKYDRRKTKEMHKQFIEDYTQEFFTSAVHYERPDGTIPDRYPEIRGPIYDDLEKHYELVQKYVLEHKDEVRRVYDRVMYYLPDYFISYYLTLDEVGDDILYTPEGEMVVGRDNDENTFTKYWAKNKNRFNQNSVNYGIADNFEALNDSYSQGHAIIVRYFTILLYDLTRKKNNETEEEVREKAWIGLIYYLRNARLYEKKPRKEKKEKKEEKGKYTQSDWQRHLEEYRKANPGTSLKDAMREASESWNKKTGKRKEKEEYAKEEKKVEKKTKYKSSSKKTEETRIEKYQNKKIKPVIMKKEEYAKEDYEDFNSDDDIDEIFRKGEEQEKRNVEIVKDPDIRGVKNKEPDIRATGDSKAIPENKNNILLINDEYEDEDERQFMLQLRRNEEQKKIDMERSARYMEDWKALANIEAEREALRLELLKMEGIRVDPDVRAVAPVMRDIKRHEKEEQEDEREFKRTIGNWTYTQTIEMVEKEKDEKDNKDTDEEDSEEDSEEEEEVPAPTGLARWQAHLKAYKRANPGVPHKQAVQNAKASYVKVAPEKKAEKKQEKKREAKAEAKAGAPTGLARWQEHLKAYKRANPGVPHKQAVQDAKASYRRAVPEKKQEKKREKKAEAKAEKKAEAKAGAPTGLARWQAHLKAYKRANPGVAHKQAVQNAKASYRKAGEPEQEKKQNGRGYRINIY